MKQKWKQALHINLKRVSACMCVRVCETVIKKHSSHSCRHVLANPEATDQAVEFPSPTCCWNMCAHTVPTDLQESVRGELLYQLEKVPAGQTQATFPSHFSLILLLSHTFNGYQWSHRGSIFSDHSTKVFIPGLCIQVVGTLDLVLTFLC